MTTPSQLPPPEIINELTQRRLPYQQGGPLKQTPPTQEQAFAWQQAVAEQLGGLGTPVRGWKCALPVEGRWGVAPIFHVHSATNCPLPFNQTRAKVEPEYAWVLTRDLLPQAQEYSPELIRSSLVCHLALEIIMDRFNADAEVDFNSRLADGLLNHAVWLGPALASAPPQIPLSWSSAEMRYRAQGKHPSGDAFAPVVWLVEFLHQRNIGLYAGQTIITGSLNGLWYLPVNSKVTIEYDALARIEIEFNSQL